MDSLEIKLIEEYEIAEVVDLIKTTCNHSSFLGFYPQSEVDKITTSLDYDGVKRRASWTHFYVFKLNNKVVGCGAIGPYWGSETESSLFTIFVNPNYQHKGIGRKIICII